MTARLDRPGYYPPPDDGEAGIWVLHVRAGGTFAVEAAAALTRTAVVRPHDRDRAAFEAIRDALLEAA